MGVLWPSTEQKGMPGRAASHCLPTITRILLGVAKRFTAKSGGAPITRRRIMGQRGTVPQRRPDGVVETSYPRRADEQRMHNFWQSFPNPIGHNRFRAL